MNTKEIGNKHTARLLTTLLLLGCCSNARAQYSLEWASPVGGGGYSTAGSYQLIGSVGCACVAAWIRDVEFTLQHIGNGQVRIGYTTNNGDAPRSIALRVNLGYATVQGPSDVISYDPAFNGFLDYAHSFPSGYLLGSGHPLADLSSPGVPDFGTGTSAFAVNMACFDETGNQSLGPVSSSNLLTLQLHGSGSTTITIDTDTARRCSIVEQAQKVNLPLQLNVTLP